MSIQEIPRGIEELKGRYGAAHDARVDLETAFFEATARSSNVAEMCGRISRSMSSWILASAKHRALAVRRNPDAEYRSMLADLAVSVEGSQPFAGRVNNADHSKIAAALSNGNIRELFYLFDSFLRRRFVRDVVGAAQRVFEAILGDLDDSWSPGAKVWCVDTRKHHRKDDVDPNVEWPGLPESKTFRTLATTPGTPFAGLRDGAPAIDSKRTGTPLAELDDKYLAGLCRQHRVTCAEDRPSRIAALAVITGLTTPSGEAHPYSWSRVPKRRLHVALSEREREFENPINQDWVPFIRGDYANVLEESHFWVRAARSNELPLRSGPSGTAHRLLSVFEALDYPVLSSRRAIAGFLGHIHAHTCHEILFATIGIGECQYDPTVYAQVLSSEGLEKLFDA